MLCNIILSFYFVKVYTIKSSYVIKLMLTSF